MLPDLKTLRNLVRQLAQEEVLPRVLTRSIPGARPLGVLRTSNPVPDRIVPMCSAIRSSTAAS